MSRRRRRSPRRGSRQTVGLTSEAICLAASGDSVAAAFARLGPINSKTDLLHSAASNDLSAQLAAEQLLHLLDGWKYASAAFTAYLVNSRSSAIHFAYYAELRAAISLFAGSGIRVNQSDSFFLDVKGNATKLTGDVRTHKLTWSIWQEWIKRTDATELLTKHVRLMTGLSLGDFTGIPSASAVALKQWGYDLFSLSKDHVARNIASYEPKVTVPLHEMLSNEPKLVKRIWTLLLPTEHGVGFDVALIYFLVDKMVISLRDADRSKTYEEHLDVLLEGVSRATGVEKLRIRSLLVDSKPDVELFAKAADQKQEAENVLCRALFLLRMATLSVANAMAPGLTNPAASWIKNWLASSGLYEDQAVELRDLAADYLAASDDFYDPSSSLPHCLWDSSRRNLNATARLTRPDAFVAWAMAL